ncbi:MAG: hypothetical protein KatS3mg118_1562 [Paracoccaceae bacterium]|nr:MAG: hypothetical protein KatS3mg118_1562 [Paracoccaceae bacterium]
MRDIFTALAGMAMAALIALAGPVAPVSAAEAVRIAIHVDENDPLPG